MKKMWWSAGSPHRWEILFQRRIHRFNFVNFFSWGLAYDVYAGLLLKCSQLEGQQSSGCRLVVGPSRPSSWICSTPYLHIDTMAIHRFANIWLTDLEVHGLWGKAPSTSVRVQVYRLHGTAVDWDQVSICKNT